MALARRVKIDPRMEPGCRGPKVLSMKVRVVVVVSISSSVRIVRTRSPEVSEEGFGYDD